jgi:hypothetical protein
MFAVERDRVEPRLPQVPHLVAMKVDPAGVLAVEALHQARQGVGGVRDGDQMDVVFH